MDYKRILTVQDISCVGQCSLTVALPIISACGIETAILPSAVLSNHTAFPDFTFCDLTGEMPAIIKEWDRQNITFSDLYTGYLGNANQVEYVKTIMNSAIETGGHKIVDPAMADMGRLYTGFDANYVEKMTELCAEADIILPNVTEACLMTDSLYHKELDKPFVEELLGKLWNRCGAKIILTGVGFSDNTNGVAVFDGKKTEYYEHRLIGGGSHGTGDVYASAFVGSLLSGKSLLDAAKIAADFTVLCIEKTNQHPEHWYGVMFETQIDRLIEMIK